MTMLRKSYPEEESDLLGSRPQDYSSITKGKPRESDQPSSTSMEMHRNEHAAKSDTSLFHSSKSRNNRVLIGVAVVVGVACVIGLAVGLGIALDDDDSTSMANQPLHVRQKRAEDLLSQFPLIDGHNDLPWQYRSQKNNSVWSVDLEKGWPTAQTDIPRIRKGKLASQFWVAYVSCKTSYKDAVRQSLDQVDVIKKMVAKYPGVFEFVTTADGIVNSFKAGKIGSLIGLEGGHSVQNSLGNLRMFYNLGVRYMTITHSCNTKWADNWKVDDDDSYEFNGLTDFGEIVIKEMNRIGMMVDLSHVSKKTMEDALVISSAPVIFSHTSAYALCNHNRNVRDDVMQLVKTNKGVIMVNFYNLYVNCSDYASLEQVADHIDYIKNQIGIDYVGIGGDYDGVDLLPTGLKDVSTYPALFAELLRRKYSAKDLEKLAGGNLLRVFRAVEKVRDDLSSQRPYEDHIDESAWRNNSCRTGF